VRSACVVTARGVDLGEEQRELRPRSAAPRHGIAPRLSLEEERGGRAWPLAGLPFRRRQGAPCGRRQDVAVAIWRRCGRHEPGRAAAGRTPRDYRPASSTLERRACGRGRKRDLSARYRAD
jgi:hypothetical protein